VADQDDIIPGLAALLVAALARRHDSAYYAVRIAARLELGSNATEAAAAAGLRKALGPVLDREQLGTVLAALEDAAAYRREYQDGDCVDCKALPKGVLCGDHETDEAMASVYDLLHGELQEHQGGGGTFRCARCGIELAAIDSAWLACARDPDADGKDSIMLLCADRDGCQERQGELAAVAPGPPPVRATLTPTGLASGSVILSADWDHGGLAEWQITVTDDDGPLLIDHGGQLSTSAWVTRPRIRVTLARPDGPCRLHVTGHAPVTVTAAEASPENPGAATAAWEED
jgi:hypothetical protein